LLINNTCAKIAPEKLSQKSKMLKSFGILIMRQNEKWSKEVISLKLELLQQLECPKNITYDTVLGHFFIVS
jgi:hypothetical protein